MSLENFKNRKIEWDTVNKNFEQSVQIINGDVNSRTLTIVITDNREPIDLTGYSVKLIYKYIYNDNSGFVMLTPTNAQIGEFTLTIPTEMTLPGIIKSNLILLNESLEQVIVSKNLKFISDDSTVKDLAQEVNNKIDDFTKLLLENMPQVMRSELNGLHAQTESNTSNIELKANSSDMTSLQNAMNSLQNKVEAFGITPENLVTIKSLLDAIASNASDSEVAELINSVNILTNNISLMSGGDYSPKANKSDLESLQSAVNSQSATVSTKANQTDLDNLKTDVTSQGVAISTKAEQADLLITNQNVTTAQTTANKAETDAQTAIANAELAKTSSLPINGNAVSATKLANARKLGVNLQTTTPQNFDGTSDVTNIGVSGVLPIANGGTGTSDGIINTTAYAYSADGTDRFTTVYPNENLFSNKNYPNNPKLQTVGIWSKIFDTNSEKSLSEKLIGYAGDVYLSFIFKNPEVIQSEPFMVQLMAFDSSGNRISQPMIGFSKNNLLDNKRVSVKFTLVNTEKSARVEFHIRTLAGSIAQNTIVEFEDFKVELGYPTIYTPSPKDSYKDAYPSYVGYSNTVKINKVASDYKWFPTIDSHTSNKNNPHAVTASQTGAYTKSEVATLISEAIKQSKLDANPIGSVVSYNSNSSSGYMTGIWKNIGSAVIGSTTIYFWQRTA